MNIELNEGVEPFGDWFRRDLAISKGLAFFWKLGLFQWVLPIKIEINVSSNPWMSCFKFLRVDRLGYVKFSLIT